MKKKETPEDIKALIDSGYRISEGSKWRGRKAPRPYWEVPGTEDAFGKRKKSTDPLFMKDSGHYLTMYANGLHNKSAELVGPVLGFNGLVGYDLDTKHLNTAEEIKHWKDKFLALAQSLKSVVIETTPSGGLHFYICYAEPTKDKNKLVNLENGENIIEWYTEKRWFASYLSPPAAGYTLIGDTTFSTLEPITNKEYGRVMDTLRSWNKATSKAYTAENDKQEASEKYKYGKLKALIASKFTIEQQIEHIKKAMKKFPEACNVSANGREWEVINHSQGGMKIHVPKDSDIAYLTVPSVYSQKYFKAKPDKDIPTYYCFELVQAFLKGGVKADTLKYFGIKAKELEEAEEKQHNVLPFMKMVTNEKKEVVYVFDRGWWLEWAAVNGIYRTKTPDTYVVVKKKIASVFILYKNDYKTLLTDIMLHLYPDGQISHDDIAGFHEWVPNLLGLCSFFDVTTINKDEITETTVSIFFHYKDKTRKITDRGVFDLAERPGVVWAKSILNYPAPIRPKGKQKAPVSIVKEKLKEVCEDFSLYKKAMGYLLCRAKKRQNAVMPVFLGDGGNFKGLGVSQFLKHARNYSTISMKGANVYDLGNFFFGKIPIDSDGTVFDECPRGFENAFTGFVTDGVEEERKFAHAISKGFHDTNKGAALTNFMPDVSTEFIRRRFPIIKMNGILNLGAKIFGRRDIFDDFTESEWNDFFLFMEECALDFAKEPEFLVDKLSPELQKEHLKTRYTRQILDVVAAFKNHTRITVKELNEALDIERKNKTTEYFLKAFTESTGKSITYTKETKDDVYGNRCWYYAVGK